MRATLREYRSTHSLRAAMKTIGAGVLAHQLLALPLAPIRSRVASCYHARSRSRCEGVVRVASKSPRPIYTIGHSNISIEEFLSLLDDADIEVLADIRSYPSSRHCPWFAKDALAIACKNHGISYHHITDLGGRRRTPPTGENAGWTNESFRSYADYMLEPSFRIGLESLETIASDHRTAYMCAEAVPWRCHRTLVSDALVAEGWDVIHLPMSTPHAHGAWGPLPRVLGGHVTYPA